MILSCNLKRVKYFYICLNTFMRVKCDNTRKAVCKKWSDFKHTIRAIVSD